MSKLHLNQVSLNALSNHVNNGPYSSKAAPEDKQINLTNWLEGFVSHDKGTVILYHDAGGTITFPRQKGALSNQYKLMLYIAQSDTYGQTPIVNFSK